jgi:hypothetical protein
VYSYTPKCSASRWPVFGELSSPAQVFFRTRMQTRHLGCSRGQRLDSLHRGESHGSSWPLTSSAMLPGRLSPEVLTRILRMILQCLLAFLVGSLWPRQGAVQPFKWTATWDFFSYFFAFRPCNFASLCWLFIIKITGAVIHYHRRYISQTVSPWYLGWQKGI